MKLKVTETHSGIVNVPKSMEADVREALRTGDEALLNELIGDLEEHGYGDLDITHTEAEEVTQKRKTAKKQARRKR